MSYEYDQYLKEHIQNVKKGLEWMRDNLGLTGDDISNAILEAEEHDRSKFDKAEYDAYDAYFYGGNRSYEVVMNFNYAWLHHQHKNPHHWQYWVLVNDDPTDGMMALPMPPCYIFEMIADWWTFSWKTGNLYSIFDWYFLHKDYIQMHRSTRRIVEGLLNQMKDKLELNDAMAFIDGIDICHSELSEEEIEKRKFGIPEQKKFPMPDADHVRSAIRFFNYVEPKYEEELAKNILKRMEEYGLTFDDISVGDENRFKKYVPEDHLEHHGILGQKWGIRRFQNKDGTRTNLGKAKEHEHTVFISGSSKTQTEGHKYYRAELPGEIKNELDRHMKVGDKIIVGDAPGIDRQVQDYLNKADYDNVEIYGPGKQVRYSANEKWKTNPIDAPEYEEGSKEWLAKKDKAMTDAADEGIAVILPDGSRATRNNAERLLDANKNVKLFQLNGGGAEGDSWVIPDAREYLNLIAYELGERDPDEDKKK